jgi:hypothetical protein
MGGILNGEKNSFFRFVFEAVGASNVARHIDFSGLIQRGERSTKQLF